MTRLKRIYERLPYLVRRSIDKYAGTVRFLTGLTMFYTGLEVMGYSLPFSVGLLILATGIGVATSYPYYAAMSARWPSGLKLICSIVIFGCLSGITGLSIIATPPGLRPVINELSGIDDSRYRNAVAETILAFEPSALLTSGGDTYGPDGKRQVDIVMRSKHDRTLTLFDVLDNPGGQPVDVDSVDIIASKRADLGANHAFLFSNTGFTNTAIRKAARENIGMLSLLRSGDNRIRIVIEEEIYLRRLSLAPVQLSFKEANNRHGEIKEVLDKKGTIEPSLIQ